MKKLLGLVVVLAVLVLGGYYAMGLVTERTVNNTVNVINRSNDIYAEVNNYHRGWFCSTATIDWTVHVPERVVTGDNGQQSTVPAQDYNLSMPLTIHHGPIIYGSSGVHFGMGYAETDIGIPEKYKADFNEAFTAASGEPKLVLSLFINYLNKSQVGIAVPAFILVSKKDKSQFDWKGLISKIKMNSDASTVKGSFDLDGIQVLKDNSSMEMGLFHGDYDLYKSDGGLYLGDVNLDFPTLAVMANKVKVFDMNGLTMNSNADISSSLFKAYMQVSLQQVLVNGQKYGPGSIEIALRNLDADALAIINQQAQIANNGTQAEKQQALMAMLPELPKLFSKGPEFEVSRFDMALPEGKVDGDLLISLPAGEIQNTFEVITKIHGKGQVHMPAKLLESLLTQSLKQQMANDSQMQQALVQQLQAGQPNQATTAPDQIIANKVQEKLNSLIDSGMIMKSGDDFVMKFELANGQFTVNGKPFNPAMLKF